MAQLRKDMDWNEAVFTAAAYEADKDRVFYFKDLKKYVKAYMLLKGYFGKTPYNTLSGVCTALVNKKFIERFYKNDRLVPGKFRILRSYKKSAKSRGETETQLVLQQQFGVVCDTQVCFPDLVMLRQLKFDFRVASRDFFTACAKHRFGISGSLTPAEMEVYNPKKFKCVLIEFDGIQHRQVVNFFQGVDGFERRCESDRRKEAYAQKNNMALIRLTRVNNVYEDLLAAFDNLI